MAEKSYKVYYGIQVGYQNDVLMQLLLGIKLGIKKQPMEIHFETVKGHEEEQRFVFFAFETEAGYKTACENGTLEAVRATLSSLLIEVHRLESDKLPDGRSEVPLNL